MSRVLYSGSKRLSDYLSNTVILHGDITSHFPLCLLFIFPKFTLYPRLSSVTSSSSSSSSSASLSPVKIDPFWFRNYLLDRSQAVKINNTVSTTSPMRAGVPQGSILGPILFTVFTNDLTETINDCLVVQYANDTQFVHSGTVDTLAHLIARAETTLSRAKSYFNSNGLLLNSNKTQCLFVGTRPAIRRIPDNTTINLNNTSITPSNISKLKIWVYTWTNT